MFLKEQGKVLRLPSVCWQELAELWGCHTEHFEAAPNKAIEIESGILYIANAHAVVHNSHVKNVTRSSGECLRCSGCLGVVGRSGPTSAALYFDCLTDERGLWSQCTQSKRLARALVDRSSSSGELRFIVPGQMTIVVVNSDTTMSVTERKHPEPVVKVRFSQIVDAVLEDDMGKAPCLDEWSQDDCKCILSALIENQRHLPSALVALSMSFLWL